MADEHKNLFTELKRLGINPNKLPDTMPDDLREAIDEVKTWNMDWDVEEGDPEEIATAKSELKKAVEDTIQLVKNWLNTHELSIQASHDKKVLLMLEDLEKQAEAENMRASGKEAFYIKPFNMVAMKLVSNQNEIGTILFKPFKFVRKEFDKFWLCQRS